MKRLAWFVLILSIFAAAQSQTPAPQPGPASGPTADSCKALIKLTLPNTKFVQAEQVEAGAFPNPTPPMNGRSAAADATYKGLPPFCRVTATLTPSPDSDIKMEVWMPARGWNGKFRGQGNGGFAGQIDYDHLAWSVSQGYATGGTDTGHAGSGTDAAWALNHPEKIADFGYRAVHEMTDKSKAIIKAYYSAPASHSYFASCSDGGREALMEAQRFPADYDGIIAGAPANNWTGLMTNALHNTLALADEGSYIPPSKLPAISAAVTAACDKLDGVADGVLNDPRQCHFDPDSMLCKDTDSNACLTAPQSAALKTLYAGINDSNGKLIFPGYLPGAEEGFNGWGTWITGPQAEKSLMYAFGYNYFSVMVYNDPAWDYKSFKTDDSYKAARTKTSQMLDSTDPNLKPFADRGGKLILYHGWNDPAISALSTIDYYQKMQSATGKQKAESFARLYMAPGLQHCFLGPGPDSFGQYGWAPEDQATDPQHNMYSALEQWVEKGTAPDKLIATQYAGEGAKRHAAVTRPLCPYPQAAKYKGTGDPNDEANFACSAK